MQSTTPTTNTSPTSTVRFVGNASELDEDSVRDYNRRNELERRPTLSSHKKRRGSNSATNKPVNVKESSDESLALFVKNNKKYLKNDDHSLPINFREVDRQWRGVEEKHNSISKKYEVDGVSTTLRAIKEHLDSENGDDTKDSVPLRVRHRFWKDLSHLDDCNTRFVLIEKNLVRAEKQKKDLRKEEEQQIAVGYRFRMFGKAKLYKPKITSGINNPSMLLPSPVASLRGVRKTPEKPTRTIPVLEMSESVIDLPYDLSLGEYLAFVREKKHEELASDPPSTERSEVATPRTPLPENNSANGTPRSILTKRKTETKVIEKPDLCLKQPSLFDQVVNIDIRTREQIEKEVSKKHKDKMRKYGHNGHSSRGHEISISQIPSVYQSLSALNNRLNSNNGSPPLSVTPDEDLLKRKRSELGLLKTTNISQLDSHHPLFYIFRMRLVNFSTSEYKLLKTRFNISISQLRSPHYIHIDTFNSNLFVTLYNQPVNELGYIVPEYHADDCIFACAECLPWLNESTVKSALNQHFRITIHDCQDLAFPVFDFIVSFSEKERVFIVSHHLIDAPHTHQASDNTDIYSEKQAKYEFLKKNKFQPKKDVDEHLQKHVQARQFLFVTFGDKDSPSSARFDLKYPPTINLVSYPRKSFLSSRIVSPTRTVFKSPEKKKDCVADISFEDYELLHLQNSPTPTPYQDVHEETLSSVETEDHHIKLPKSRDTKRYFDFSKSKKNIPYIASYKPSDYELVSPDNPSIKSTNIPTTFYSHETNRTVMLSSSKDKNVKVILPPKRIPHSALPVVDARTSLPKPIRFGALDNTQKILKEQRLIFREQQKSGALGMIDFNNFDEIRKGAPSTDCIAVGDRKLSVALEQ